jgi:transcriptional regulator with PAS, ATPase and Fis domain
MLAALDLAERVAKTNATVLIQGESGSGKEVIARALHHLSMRCKRPWVDVSCGALPEHLMESELFGYERGAFSGADTAKPGLFELAQSGTLFLDEVGELEPKMQVKLLRVLDGTPYYRLGGTRKITVDVRVLAATNANLEEAVAAGRFRRDLYHRLSQMTLRVPPLRERPEDVEALAHFFLRQQAPQAEITSDGLAALRHYHWPGNVRELRNVVTRAAILAGELPLGCQDFDLPNPTWGASPPGPVALPAPPSKHAPGNLDGLERQTILRVLRETNGHRQQAADVLGISRRTLSRKLKLYRLAEHSLDEIPLGRVWSHGKQLPGKTA